jgi:hypothetical protein
MGPFSPVLELTEGMSMTAQFLPERHPAGASLQPGDSSPLSQPKGPNGVNADE